MDLLPYDVIFLSDAQDLWLFNYFFFAKGCRRNIKVIYFPSDKCTTPELTIPFLERFEIPRLTFIKYEGLESVSFKQCAEGCRWFITKDFLPKGLSKEILEKTIVVSWVGESARRESSHSRHGIVEEGYKRLYVERVVAPLYNHLGHSSNFPSPKYHFLNYATRESLCKLFNLDPSQKYVTVFSNPNFNAPGDVHAGGKDDTNSDDLREDPTRVNAIYRYIEAWCKKNNIKIILKNKAKHGDYFTNVLEHDEFIPGNPSWFHNALILLAISEFSVGLSTCAVMEAAELGARIISFWKHDRGNTTSELYEDIVALTTKNNVYCMIQDENVFNVHLDDNLNDIVDDLEHFIQNSKSIKIPGFKLDPFLQENFGDWSGFRKK